MRRINVYEYQQPASNVGICNFHWWPNAYLLHTSAKPHIYSNYVPLSQVCCSESTDKSGGPISYKCYGSTVTTIKKAEDEHLTLAKYHLSRGHRRQWKLYFRYDDIWFEWMLHLPWTRTNFNWFINCHAGGVAVYKWNYFAYNTVSVQTELTATYQEKMSAMFHVGDIRVTQISFPDESKFNRFTI